MRAPRPDQVAAQGCHVCPCWSTCAVRACTSHCSHPHQCSPPSLPPLSSPLHTCTHEQRAARSSNSALATRAPKRSRACAASSADAHAPTPAGRPLPAARAHRRSSPFLHHCAPITPSPPLLLHHKPALSFSSRRPASTPRRADQRTADATPTPSPPARLSQPLLISPHALSLSCPSANLCSPALPLLLRSSSPPLPRRQTCTPCT